MSRRGCGCCDEGNCCVTPIDMAATVSWATFGDAEVDINISQYCGRTGTGNSVTDIPLSPDWGVNADIEGRWITQNYESLFWAKKTRIDPSPYSSAYWLEECYSYIKPLVIGLPANLVSEEVPISGEFDLVVGGEPEGPPFFATVEYYLFNDPVSDDCIMRVGAKCNPNGGAAINAWADDFDFHAVGSSLGFWHWLWGTYWGPNTAYPWYNSNVVFKYSDYHPCAESDGVLPPIDSEPGDEVRWFYSPISGLTAFPGTWLSGFRVTLEDWLAGGTKAVNSYTGPNGTCLAADVVPDPNDSGYPVAGWGWFWEINLTDAGITSLADLPDTTLDKTNLTGSYVSSLSSGPFVPVASFPVGWDNEEVSFYLSGSTALWGDSAIEKITAADQTADPNPAPYLPYEVKNGGLGGHVCQTPPDELSCTDINGDPITTQGGWIDPDILTWKWRVQVVQSTYEKTIGSFSVLLKQAVP